MVKKILKVKVWISRKRYIYIQKPYRYVQKEKFPGYTEDGMPRKQKEY